MSPVSVPVLIQCPGSAMGGLEDGMGTVLGTVGKVGLGCDTSVGL